MARYFLNEIDQRDGSVGPPTAGAWKSDADSTDFLTRFAASIKITGQLTNAHLVHSVPSMFARPILFYQALANTEHPLHKEVVSQWRGLLGLFALQKVEGLVLSVRRYSVPTLDEAQGRADRNLSTALRNQLPYPPEDWDHWWLIYCNGVLVGATSPWSMFYTPSQYACPSVIPWRDEKTGLLLADPLTHYGKLAAGNPLPEVTVLLRWIELVLDGASWGLDDKYPMQSGRVKKELELWRNELRPQRDPEISILRLNGDARIESGPWKFFSQGPAYEPSGNQSTLILDTRPGVPQTLVLSRTALKDSDRVWGKTFAHQINFSELQGPKGSSFTARNGAEIKTPYVIAEEEFFPKKLMRIPLSPRAYSCGADDYAIPLTPAFFSYFSHDLLLKNRDALSVAVSPDRVTVTLRLPLSGSQNRLKVEKTYNVQNDVVECPDPIPALAVWPDFRAKDWSEYFAACAGTETMPPARPLLEDGSLLASLPSSKRGNLRIWPCTTPPVGFAIFHRFSLSQERAENLHCVGMVLAGDPGHLASPDGNISWRVAVDFGTSSTNVLVDKGGGPPESLSIEGRTVMLTGGEEAMKGDVTTGLYPTSPILAPFATLLAKNTASFPKDAPPYTPRFILIPGGDDEYLSDVKWSTGGGTKDLPLREYLRNIVRLIACEARQQGVGKLSFEWSYPLSLPAGPRGAMGDYWNGVANAYSQKGGMSVSAAKGVTESDAVCRCFAAQATGPVPVGGSGLSIMLDIGGGSSDIGYWSSRRLLDQVSIKLGGNDLLPRLWSLEEFMPKFYSVCMGEQWDETYTEKFRSRPAIFVNNILSEAQAAGGDPKRHPFVLHLLKEPYGEKPWVKVRSLLFLFFAGLSLYLGLHARKHRSTTNTDVDVYFGGRGSSLIPWIGSPENVKSRLEYFFRFGFERDAPENKNAAIKFRGPALSTGSVQPKEEVVRGLLTQIADWKAQPVSMSTTIPCETAWELDGKTVRWDEPLSAEALRRLKPPTNHESSFISTLMNLIADKGLDDLNLDPALKGLWSRKGGFSNKVEQYLSSMFIAEDPVLQPVFTCELAALMDQYVQETLSGSPTGT